MAATRRAAKPKSVTPRASVADFERITSSLLGTTTARHFDRTAYRVARIYATLPTDGSSANLLFSPLERDRFCALPSGGFAPVPGGWGRMGFTTVTFALVTAAELEDALKTAWARALPRPRKASSP